MRIRRLCWVLLTVVLLSPIHAKKNADNIDVNDGEKAQEKIPTLKVFDEDKNKTSKVQEVVASAMKIPEKREQIGEVIPIMRSMSPPQKLAMATIISTRISNNETTFPPLEEAQSLLGDGNQRENASRELMLPISMDIAKIISSDDSDSEESNEEEEDEMPEALPEAQELRLIRPQERRRPVYVTSLRPARPSHPNRRNVYTGQSRLPVIRPSKRPNDPKRRPTENECTFFTKTVCLEANDYPHEAIMRSLRSNKEMVAALLTDYKAQDYGSEEEKLPSPLPLENKYENRYESNEIKRRSDNPFDNVEEGFTCPSTVKYARPQLARAASGVWKYIINTGEHTQTIRLEKCSNPHSTCSFISENYRSSCVQIYNYHRLLTWDQKLGLHMDIFKVPTCCSCHVHGYSEIFPPHQKDPPMKTKETFPGADFVTINDSKDDFQGSLNHISKYTPTSNYDSNHVSSNKNPVLDVQVTSRPTFTLPSRNRPKKPAPIPRPYDKLPQQHAPNTRAPGYKGPLTKIGRPNRPNRPPFRRESTSHDDYAETSHSNSTINRYSQPYDQDVDATSRLQNGGFDDEYHEPHRRINYNYHPIIDFFKPEASMLQSAEPQLTAQPATIQSDNSAWKPMIS
ncbi:neurotrophin 1 isoform X1 [Camponotus floridanus]|uniref:neurotrophin 1 isoform X1 n=1 Tax=Camponotus floridanus TaxID=104421 RepID=UPI00059EB8DC|nr:neurotrophin 1 isoform X1 [Camponotus floridanus]